MKHKVLFVDDDKSILLSLKNDLTNHDYEIILTNSGDEALEVLEKEKVSVVVSDVLMPGMNGVEFLEKSIPLNPNSIRIVLSGNSELDLITDSINKGHIWQYIPKPWHKLKLRTTIKNAIDIFETKENEKRLVNELQEKNELLQNLNVNLENIVSQRTWLIRKRSELLNSLLEGCVTEEVIKNTCEVISKILNGKPVYVDSKLLSQGLSTNSKNVIPDQLMEISKKCEKNKESYISKNGIGLVLHNLDTYLGTLLYFWEENIDKKIDDVEDFVYVITFALSQKKVLESTPEIIQTINSIIEDS